MHTFLYVISCSGYLLLKITSIPALNCEVQVRYLKQRKLFFKLCAIVSKYVQHIFPVGANIFLRGSSSPPGYGPVDFYTSQKTNISLSTLSALAKFDLANQGVRQPVQLHTFNTQLPVFEETLAQPHFVVVNCPDVVMRVFYSILTRSLIFLQLWTAVLWRWVYFPPIALLGALIVYIHCNDTWNKRSGCRKICISYVNKLRLNVGLETWKWRQIVTSQTAHTKYKWLPHDAETNPSMKIFCAHHWMWSKLCKCATEHTMVLVNTPLSSWRWIKVILNTLVCGKFREF